MSVDVVPYAGRKQQVQPSRRQTSLQSEGDAQAIHVATYKIRNTDDHLPVSSISATIAAPSRSEAIQIRPLDRSTRDRKTTAHEKTLRRFHGFLVEDEGEEARVMLIADGKPIAYYLPASQLKRAGITAQNQPFEMNELEIKLSDGLLVTAYSFVPLAKPADAFSDSVKLDDARHQKLNAIFEKFGKAQG